MEALHAELNEKTEVATSSYSATTVFFCNIIILCFWLRTIRRADRDV